MGAYDCDCINNLEYDRRERKAQLSQEGTTSDLISRQEAIDAVVQCTNCGNEDTLRKYVLKHNLDNGWTGGILEALDAVKDMPPAQPERKWTPCSNPPKHHKDVIVRGIEAIGNVTVHKVMQWDVDTWRPTDYAPSIMWKEWSEI